MRAGTHPKTLGSVPTSAVGNRPSARVSRVSRLCPIFRAQPGAYPPKAKNGCCAGMRESGRKALEQDENDNRKAACGKRWKRRNGQNRGILDAAARKRRESRINGWRRNRRFSCSQQPAVRTVSRGCAGAAIGACLEKNTRGWRQKSHKCRRFKGFRCASAQNGGL